MSTLPPRMFRILVVGITALSISLLSANIFPLMRVQASAAAHVCYAVEQKAVGPTIQNSLATLNLATGAATIIGQTNTSFITSLAFQPYTNNLFAAVPATRHSQSIHRRIYCHCAADWKRRWERRQDSLYRHQRAELIPRAVYSMELCVGQ